MAITQLATGCLANALLHTVNNISFVYMLAFGMVTHIFLILGGISSCSYVKGV